MVPLKIVCRDFKVTPAIRTELRNCTSKLEEFFPRLVRCEVAISVPHRRRNKGNVYHVALRIEVPGPDIVVNRESEEDVAHENLRIAINDAFRAAERKLEDLIREMRGFVKAPGVKSVRGRVTKLFPERDFGFLETAEGEQVYFHRNSLKGISLERLKPGVTVHFKAEQGEKGPQATYVRAVRRTKQAGRQAA